MKSKHLFLLLFLACTLSSYNDASYEKKGITFFKGSWEEALIKAKKENKYIFIDFYATWCGPCKKLKRTSFKDPKVGAYYNKNFINISIDAESKEGIKIARRYGVSSYPTLIITDYNGKKKTKTTGFKKPHILINFGRRIVP
ncbi:thioredoxin fold domain-containing protein [uncultured Dokdonia sp.]|uniref:thioredoxin family protein n=1 Tax=uncultured Dokdonia sp. TaxID=575653 RepID=UPI00261C976F|nr:thioredoxin fold domain-containing protein [uncultured Dokdonia sp.]